MAVNNERSMNTDMMLGALDRSRHYLTPGRGGIIEKQWPVDRANHLMRGSWTPAYYNDALMILNDDDAFLRSQMFDAALRDQVSVITGPTARTRPVARNQFEANPFPTPLDAVHTSWPDQY
jgi:hypothetical protein